MSRLGDLIRQERVRRGLTPKGVARKCGVSEKFLLEIEAGTRIPRDDQAQRILKAMGAEAPAQSGFTLEDIAATVDLQSALPRASEPKKKKGREQDKGVAGSIWLDALSDVLQHVPVYNAVMHEVGSRLLPVKDGKVEGAPKDKVFYFTAPDDAMRGFRVHRGDLVLVVPSKTAEDAAMVLLDTPQGKQLRLIKLLPRYQVMLQRYDSAFESEIVNMSDLHIVGRCVRLEAEL
ncbi:MAG: helix-turn-helix domain-containing protein [Eubacteriales bacterium]|nr:helix-turn-helix domain-containing protein [Eubacteriales bacterium]